MAKQVGIVPLIGTIDGINFYKRKGKLVARKAGGGFTKDAIKNKPSMVRVRESNSEFGHCSRVKKLFKDSLLPFLGKQRNEELQSRLMQLFIKIKDADSVSERGKRQIGNGLKSAEGQALLDGFCVTPFDLPTENGSFDSETTTYTLNGFSAKGLKFMAGATHFELQFGVVILDLAAMTAVLYKGDAVYLPKDGTVQDISLPVAVPENVNGIRIGVLHYRFSQEVNGAFYGFKEEKGFGLKVVGLEIEDGRWEMEDGRWKMEDGRLRMGDGRWKMEDGRLVLLNLVKLFCFSYYFLLLFFIKPIDCWEWLLYSEAGSSNNWVTLMLNILEIWTGKVNVSSFFPFFLLSILR